MILGSIASDSSDRAMAARRAYETRPLPGKRSAGREPASVSIIAAAIRTGHTAHRSRKIAASTHFRIDRAAGRCYFELGRVVPKPSGFRVFSGISCMHGRARHRGTAGREPGPGCSGRCPGVGTNQVGKGRSESSAGERARSDLRRASRARRVEDRAGLSRRSPYPVTPDRRAPRIGRPPEGVGF